MEAAAALGGRVRRQRRQNIATYITLDGQIAPLNQSTLAFQQSGTITKINVNIGDMVRQGPAAGHDRPLDLAGAALASASAGGAGRGFGAGRGRRLSGADADQLRRRANRQGVTAERQARVQSKQAALQTGLRFGDAAQQSQANYVQAQQTYNNAVVGLRNNAVSYQNVKSQQASAQAASAQAHVLSTQLSQTYLYSPYDAVVANRLVDPVRTRRPRSRCCRSRESIGFGST